MTTLGIDVGGTKILVAAVDEDGTPVHTAKRATPTGGADAVIAAIADAAREAARDAGLTALPPVGIGVPGPVENGVLLEAPNLEGFDEPVELAAQLSEVLETKVFVGNDANVGTLGEARHGAGVGATDILGCWLGTGVGGGLVLDGRLRSGPNGIAAEIGHVPIEMTEPRTCACGRIGCLEAYAGRASLEARVREAVEAGETTALHDIMRRKGKDRLTSGVWKRALKDGDALAMRLIDETVIALGAGLAGIVNVLDVQRVVFGGGLAEKLGQDLVDRIAAEAGPRLMAPTVTRTWVVASLDDDSGVIGAAVLAREEAASAGGS